VFENVALPLEIDRTLDGAARHRVEKLLRAVGLSDRSSAPAESLSIGERQRCLFARALVREPLVLLLDDPTVALADDHIADFVAMIESEQLRGMTIVIATSDPRLQRLLPKARLVLVAADRLVVAL
jgi:ABC-type ATPase involved in cell division